MPRTYKTEAEIIKLKRLILGSSGEPDPLDVNRLRLSDLRRSEQRFYINNARGGKYDEIQRLTASIFNETGVNQNKKLSDTWLEKTNYDQTNASKSAIQARTDYFEQG